jgi:DNA mismatch repair protein MLH3
LSLSSLDPGQGCHAQEQRNTCDILYDGYGATDSNNTSRRFHKSDLRNAQVVNQVDRKFIACLIDKTGDDGKSGESKVVGSRALVLVDQHAADERVRVERFLKELCSGFLRHRHGTGGVRTRDLSPSLPVLLTRREALHLTGSCSFRQAFESWGFRFGDFPQLEGTPYGSEEGADNSSSSGYVQVLVHSIPEVVSDKVGMSFDLALFLWSHFIVAFVGGRASCARQRLSRHTGNRSLLCFHTAGTGRRGRVPLAQGTTMVPSGAVGFGQLKSVQRCLLLSNCVL